MRGLPNKKDKKTGQKITKSKTNRLKAPLLNPEFFKDDLKELANRFNKMSSLMTRQGIAIASDGSPINLMLFKHIFLKRVEHLPVEEQIFLEHRFDRFSKLKQRLGAIKIKMKVEIGENFEELLEVKKTYIFELFAQHHTIDEIHKKLIEESGENSITISSIKRFYQQYRPQIEKLQLDYEKELGAIGISRKRSRLEVLDYMLRKTKQDYDSTAGIRMLPYSREMGRILEQARKEVEGEQIKLNIDGTINITATIESAKNVEQLYSDINFMTLLIARVAARMRINPLLLQYQLTNSWYAKFTGIKRNESLMDETPDYPSKIILNWNDLQSKADQKEKHYEALKQKFADEVEFEPTVDETIIGSKLREALKMKLKEKQADLDLVKNRILGG